MELDWVFFVLVAGSFIAAAFNAAFAVGGAMIILAATTAVLPLVAVVPIAFRSVDRFPRSGVYACSGVTSTGTSFGHS